MQRLENFISNNPGKVFLILILAALPAFLINLGLLPLFADEPTRANVALEMILSKNFSVPTVASQYYYNKPPFYNWLLASCYLLTGSYSEFVTRLPAIIPMFLFAISIYLWTTNFLKDKRVAALSGIFFLVNGRMLLYDSMLGHIDIFYSFLTFNAFMLIFYFYERKNWFGLFAVSYIITAIAFLCKGLPSILFQGFTLIALCIYTKNIKKLVSWQHILSGIICLLIISAYFYNYSLYNPNLTGYFNTIWNQSSQRTAAEAGFGKTLKYIFTFPLEHLGHLAPASLLTLFCFHKHFYKRLFRNQFLKFITITFLVNIWVYWLSPETRPRYLLMLYPLLFIIWSHSYYYYRSKLPLADKLLNAILLTAAILTTVLIPAAFFAGLQEYVAFLTVKILLVFILMAAFSWMIYKSSTHKMILFTAFLLVVRLAFSWFVLPHRLHKDVNNYLRQSAIEIGRISQHSELSFYQYHPDVLDLPFHHRLIFYMERERMQQVKFSELDTKPGYYFTFDRNLKNPNSILIKEYQGNLKLFRVK